VAVTKMVMRQGWRFGRRHQVGDVGRMVVRSGPDACLTPAACVLMTTRRLRMPARLLRVVHPLTHAVDSFSSATAATSSICVAAFVGDLVGNVHVKGEIGGLFGLYAHGLLLILSCGAAYSRS
jgi:hypothetical protein